MPSKIIPSHASIGRDVHYVSVTHVHWAAKINSVYVDGTVKLTVFSPSAIRYANNVEQDPLGKKPNTWHVPERGE